MSAGLPKSAKNAGYAREGKPVKGEGYWKFYSKKSANKRMVQTFGTRRNFSIFPSHNGLVPVSGSFPVVMASQRLHMRGVSHLPRNIGYFALVFPSKRSCENPTVRTEKICVLGVSHALYQRISCVWRLVIRDVLVIRTNILDKSCLQRGKRIPR
jgi:hypothetical protein